MTHTLPRAHVLDWLVPGKQAKIKSDKIEKVTIMFDDEIALLYYYFYTTTNFKWRISLPISICK